VKKVARTADELPLNFFVITIHQVIVRNGVLDFRDFSGAKVCYSNSNVKFENLMHSEWREEKFLKGIVGEKIRLRF